MFCCNIQYLIQVFGFWFTKFRNGMKQQVDFFFLLEDYVRYKLQSILTFYIMDFYTLILQSELYWYIIRDLSGLSLYFYFNTCRISILTFFFFGVKFMFSLNIIRIFILSQFMKRHLHPISQTHTLKYTQALSAWAVPMGF